MSIFWKIAWIIIGSSVVVTTFLCLAVCPASSYSHQIIYHNEEEIESISSLAYVQIEELTYWYDGRKLMRYHLSLCWKWDRDTRNQELMDVGLPVRYK